MEKLNKSQPQALLEEIIGAEGQRADFPSIEAQQEYWNDIDVQYEAWLKAHHAQQQEDNR